MLEERFVETLIEFLQSDKLELVRQVIITISNMIDVAMKLGKGDIIYLLKRDEVFEIFGELEEDLHDETIEKLINHIREVFDSLPDQE